MKFCISCKKVKFLSDYVKDCSRKDGYQVYCKECFRNKGYKSKYKKSLKGKQANQRYQKNNPGTVNAKTARRRATKLKATPKWLTIQQLQEIKNIYTQCAKINRTSEIEYEVDHIFPLQGDNSCGLHVPWNLQIIEKSVNRSKGNKENYNGH
jgi:5-methylcytosine-specific restriction endonuclease McrA